jgi:hypothetical protein
MITLNDFQRQWEDTRVGVLEAVETRIAVEADPMVEKAVESMPKAMALVQSAHRVIVQRLSK